jgi:hypothetical protein
MAYPGNDSFTKLLTHCDDVVGQTCVDVSVGGSHGAGVNTEIATIDGSVKKFGDGSTYIEGGGWQWGVSTDWLFGYDPFTIDFWWYSNSNDGGRQLFAWDRVGVGIQGGMILHFNGSFFEFQSYGIDTIWCTAPLPDLSVYYQTWTHIAWVRKGITAGDFMLFVNGISQEVTFTWGDPSSNFTISNSKFNIGSGWGTATSNIDEFRVSKGIARWTSNFTPPARAYGSELGAFNMPRFSKDV